jgi:porphobilinogen synthase
VIRPRRLRRSEGLRRLVRETRLDPAALILPLFVVDGHDVREPIGSLPGVFHLSPDAAAAEAATAAAAGVGGVILFGLPATKDAEGSSAWDPVGPVPLAARAIRAAAPELVIASDLCLCQYTDHGHCGVLGDDGEIANDETLVLLARAAVAHARAGVDLIAPSDMMDGRVAAIRSALDGDGFAERTGIMSYSSKFASSFYGPFRDAAHSTPAFGDRRTYQLDGPNGAEAIRESLLDEAEGADLLMVKPALPYLDVIARLAAETRLPIAAYQVSGEHAMLHAAAASGSLDRRAATLEALTSIRRAGARVIVTYAAVEVAGWLA